MRFLEGRQSYASVTFLFCIFKIDATIEIIYSILIQHSSLLFLSSFIAHTYFLIWTIIIEAVAEVWFMLS
jgi:hypothetical protein